MKKSNVASLLILPLTSIVAHAAVPRDFVVDVTATQSDTVPRIKLSWTQKLQSSITTQKLYRREKGDTTWALLSDLTATQTSFSDSTALAGVEYEYWMQRKFTGISPNVALGYLSSGVKVPAIQSRGRLILAIDSTMVAPLAAEIALLKTDLAADGWTVRTVITPRTGTVPATKALIESAYDEDPVNTRSLFLLGRVPVPYSGSLGPDGHPDHVGTWPADSFYGDFDGVWTDSTVNITSASGTRNDNVPGDGKYDQSTLPSAVELEIGRVDFAEMNLAPSSEYSEIVLLRRYLRQEHQFRHKLGAYASIPRRSIIRDGFGHLNSIEPIAIQAWSTALSSIGNEVDVASNNQWFTDSFASGKTYLFGHGCGGGSFTSVTNMGTSTDFGTKPSRAVFTSLFGSYFGDWAGPNSVLRAAICGNADGTSLGLTSLWSGRPHWYTHQVGMGETWGYATRASVNTGFDGSSNRYVPSTTASKGIHIALMGDPTLRIHIVEPPRGLAASGSSGNVQLSWKASGDSAVAGYHVYRGTSPSGPFVQLTTSPLTTPGYIDSTATSGLTFTYLVKTLKLESVPGGSYYNLSIGSQVTATPLASLVASPLNPSDLEATPSSAGATSVDLVWSDNSTAETGYRIERCEPPSTTFTVIADLPADSTSFTDTDAPYHDGIYIYRVIATGDTDSAPSNEAIF